MMPEPPRNSSRLPTRITTNALPAGRGALAGRVRRRPVAVQTLNVAAGFEAHGNPREHATAGNRSAFALRARGSLGRPARNQVDREEELARSDGAGGDHLEEQTHRLLAGFVKRNVDRRQWRHGEGGHLDVIATDDRAVLWHALA